MSDSRGGRNSNASELPGKAVVARIANMPPLDIPDGEKQAAIDVWNEFWREITNGQYIDGNEFKGENDEHVRYALTSPELREKFIARIHKLYKDNPAYDQSNAEKIIKYTDAMRDVHLHILGISEELTSSYCRADAYEETGVKKKKSAGDELMALMVEMMSPTNDSERKEMEAVLSDDDLENALQNAMEISDFKTYTMVSYLLEANVYGSMYNAQQQRNHSTVSANANIPDDQREAMEAVARVNQHGFEYASQFEGLRERELELATQAQQLESHCKETEDYLLGVMLYEYVQIYPEAMPLQEAGSYEYIARELMKDNSGANERAKAAARSYLAVRELRQTLDDKIDAPARVKLSHFKHVFGDTKTQDALKKNTDTKVQQFVKKMKHTLMSVLTLGRHSVSKKGFFGKSKSQKAKKRMADVLDGGPDPKRPKR